MSRPRGSVRVNNGVFAKERLSGMGNALASAVQGAEIVFCYRWKRTRRLAEIVLVIWVATCMYAWFVLDGSAAYTSRHFPAKVRIVIQETRKRIWPYVWRQYIFADPKNK